MSRFTLATVAEMMEYKNVNGYSSPAQMRAPEIDCQAEAFGIFDWLVEMDHLKKLAQAGSSQRL